MPILRLKEIREMSDEDRVEKLNELKTELRKLNSMTKGGGSVDSPSRLKEIRKTVARILTIQNAKRLKGKGDR